MSDLVQYRNQVTELSNSNLQPTTSRTVFITKRGATVKTGATSATQTMYGGCHRFVAGNKVMIAGDESTYTDISSVTSDTVIVLGASITTTASQRLVNLGADTGAASPNYDGADSVLSIWSVPDSTATAITDNKVTTDGTDGEFGFYVATEAAAGVVDISIMNSSGTLGSASETHADILVARDLSRYNVKDYGAKGDGTANDTVAVQAAIDDIPAAGGILWFPDKATYLLGALTCKSNLTIDGGGSIIQAAAHAMLDFTSDSNIVIENCRFDGDTTYERLIVIEKATGVLIRNCRFTDMLDAADNSDGHHLISAGGSKQVTVSECEFIDTNGISLANLGKSSVADGTDVGALDFTWVNNRQIRIGTQGDAVGLGVYANPDVSSCKRVIYNNNVCDTGGHPVQLNGVDGFACVGNVFENLINGPVVASFNAASASTEISITGNVCIDITDEAIAVVDGDGAVVSGNDIQNAQFGVSMQGCIDSSVTGNMIRDITKVTNKLGIEIKGSTLTATTSRMMVSGNQANNCTVSCIRVVGACTDVTVSGNAVGETADAGAIGIELTTSSAAITDVHVIGNKIDNIEKGINARSWTGGSCIGNSVKTTGGAACEIDSLDSNTTSDLIIAGNYFDGGAGDFGLRIDDTNTDSSGIVIAHNVLKGNGTNSLRLDASIVNSMRVMGNVNALTTEGFTVADDAVEVSQSTAVEVVTATGGMQADVGEVYFQSGISGGTYTLNREYGGMLIKFYNESGGTVTLAVTAGDTIITPATTYVMADQKQAIFRFKFSTQDWELLYDEA